VVASDDVGMININTLGFLSKDIAWHVSLVLTTSLKAFQSRTVLILVSDNILLIFGLT
jgi:hypothetical protein